MSAAFSSALSGIVQRPSRAAESSPSKAGSGVGSETVASFGSMRFPMDHAAVPADSTQEEIPS